MGIDSIPSRIFAKGKTRGSSPAYYVRQGGSWVPTNWADYASQIRTAAKALIALGFEPGQSTCILGFNRPEWTVFDVATMAAGGAPAGIYTTCSPSEVQYIISHCEAPFVLLEDEGQWAKVNEERDNLPNLKKVVMMKGAPAIDDELVMSWDEFVALASEVSDDQLEERLEGLKEEQLATFIYTSGTTGPPKGVMLSHKNLSWTADCAQSITDVAPTDCSLSYLPLSHIAEQMFTIHVPATAGSAVYYAESIEKVADNLKEVQPTVFFGVPRIWEKFHAGITAKLKDATGVKAKLVSWARGVGTEVSKVKNSGGTPGGLLAFQYNLANKVIFSKLKPAIGLGRARICVSGAAPIARDVLEFFASLDVVVHEVYGQSEDSGPTSFNLPGRTKFGTVGPAIDGVTVKIADDGEICVQGPNVFMGYYKDQGATDECLIDGWLHSGDLGKIDADGYLSITGRKKEIIITAGGKNIAPKNLEAALKRHDVINEAVVVGDRRKYLVALVTIDPEIGPKWAADNGENFDTLHDSEKLAAELSAHREEINKEFARVEQIKKLAILPRNFTIEDNELTPTLKVKRAKVHKNWEDAIEALYAE